MSDTLTCSLRDGRLHLVGRIDENADLPAVASQIPAEGATLDLGGLTRINSIGVREWMDFIAQISSRKLRLERCAPAFVDQLNAIANFAGDAEVVSVLTAFECEDDSELVTTEARTADVARGVVPTPPPCPRCGAMMVPVQEDELYYRFLRYR